MRRHTDTDHQVHPIALPAGGDPHSNGDAGAAQFLNSRRKAIFAQMSEFRGFSRSGQEVEAAGAVPDRPVVVVSRGQRAWPAGDQGDLMEAAWTTLQRQLAMDLSAQRHVIAETSAHQIHRDAPQRVLEAIRWIAAHGQHGAAHAAP